MATSEYPKQKIARTLLSQNNLKKRKFSILTYRVILIALFLAHHYFSGLDTPLKIIPQTMSAMGMGYVISLILSMRQFKHLSEFVDWPKVRESIGADR